MGKIKSALSFTGNVLAAMGEREMQVKNMTQQIVNRAHGVDLVEAEKIARILVDQAEVTWK